MAKARGILLYSGGLDSIIAAKVLMMQDVDLTAFQCLLPFVPPDFDTGTLPSAAVARRIGLPVVYHRLGRDYIDLVRNPPHGYGKHMNPCIDCKIHFIRKAAACMKETGADFVATGEVVGQRPMSQMKHMLNHIAKESGIEERLVRPLSARILKPTLPEEQGMLDRGRLLGLNGRSRKVQMQMADEFGITEYSSPAGGCLFTDVNISRRVRDLFDHHHDCDALDLYLLTLGRHFRLSPGVKAIASRNEQENIELEKYISAIDYVFMPLFQGPLVALKGDPGRDVMIRACAIMARYSKAPLTDARVNVFHRGKQMDTMEITARITDEELDDIRI
ncbi:MAG TPA: hypothetical protein PK926_05650 [Spirochaetota bacterium]|nr:hypothetical protein [Spirochaetota bacterium]HPI87752.1 hypothetical protein [Spirochaetota bacterium]HPR48123.1 hypothetical protein [Spirochaetota bacterium]